MSARLDNVHIEVADALAELSRLFTPGMRLTFIARHPDHDERHVIVTDDDVKALAEMLKRKVKSE